MPVINFRITGLENLATQYPNRIKWAIGETMKMVGGHMRKFIRRYIENGGEGWQPLRAMTLKTRKESDVPQTPLYFLGRMVRFRYMPGKNPRVTIGWLNRKVQAIVKKQEEGKTVRVTRAMRRHLAAMGIPIRKDTRQLVIPSRRTIDTIFQREEKNIPAYLEKRFWQKFNESGGKT